MDGRKKTVRCLDGTAPQSQSVLGGHKPRKGQRPALSRAVIGEPALRWVSFRFPPLLAAPSLGVLSCFPPWSAAACSDFPPSLSGACSDFPPATWTNVYKPSQSGAPRCAGTTFARRQKGVSRMRIIGVRLFTVNACKPASWSLAGQMCAGQKSRLLPFRRFWDPVA